jgi:NADH-quinone oxidoreductase subunit I
MEKQTHEMTLWERMYVPEVFKGLATTLRHIPRKKKTVLYPEVRTEHLRPHPERYRGMHRLTHDVQGRVKCVACFMCATACPADCITIVGQATPVEWDDREKMPAVFEIDELRCIFCGYCVEACPEDAIRMDTNVTVPVYGRRQDFIFDRDQLLSHQPRMDLDDEYMAHR